MHKGTFALMHPIAHFCRDFRRIPASGTSGWFSANAIMDCVWGL